MLPPNYNLVMVRACVPPYQNVLSSFGVIIINITRENTIILDVFESKSRAILRLGHACTRCGPGKMCLNVSGLQIKLSEKIYKTKKNMNPVINVYN